MRRTRLTILALTFALAACAGTPESRMANTVPLENCARIAVPGYGPDAVDLLVVDALKPAFTGRPHVVATTTEAMEAAASVCVTWVGIDRAEADRQLRDGIRERMAYLPRTARQVDFN